MFMPIPFEMLKTFEEKPQMIVNVGTEPAVCHAVDCGFVHIAAAGEITSFTYDAASSTLTITGTDLPTNTNLVQSIEYAKSNCTITNADASGVLPGTSVVCTLDRTPTCGSYKPLLTTFKGNVAHASGLAS